MNEPLEGTILDPAGVRQVVAFLKEHRVVHLASSGEGGPHSTPLFYALAGGGPDLVWISDPSLLHSRHVGDGASVSGSVCPSTPPAASVRGLQLRGTAAARPEEQAELRAIYLKEFPTTRALLEVSDVHVFYRLSVAWARLIRWDAGLKRNVEGRLPPLT